MKEIPLAPTRRLTTKEKIIFDRVASEFNHLAASDEEQLTLYAECAVRYQIAAKETKKNPILSIPIINRSTGNVTGSKPVRNPAFVTLRESLAAMGTLGRRLMIDAHSKEKRLRLESKHLRSSEFSVFACNDRDATQYHNEEDIPEEVLQMRIRKLAVVYTNTSPEDLRGAAIWSLMYGDESDPDPEIEYLYNGDYTRH